MRWSWSSLTIPRFWSRETTFALVLFVLGEVLANIFDLYDAYAGYDVIMHFVGGVLVSTIVFNFVKSYLKEHSYALAALVTIGIGALWEVAEFFADFFLGWSLQLGLRDTMGDLIVVSAAATITSFIYWWKTR